MRLGGWMLLAGTGALGTICRYALGGWIARATGGGFPWETCAINVLGCFAIGGVVSLVDRGATLHPVTRVAVTVGFLGGFTTFSTFGLETFRLLEDAEWGRACAYLALTNVGGLAAVWSGYRLLQILG